MDQLIKNMLQCIDSFAQDILRIANLEHSISILSKRVDFLKHEYNHSRAREEEK
jgi:hypothetical protein